MPLHSVKNDRQGSIRRCSDDRDEFVATYSGDEFVRTDGRLHPGSDLPDDFIADCVTILAIDKQVNSSARR